ncbi:MAG: hypothetical protein ACLP7A_00240 [Desulfobaccales bacterium]
MNTDIDPSISREKQQALEDLRNELHKIFQNLVGKEPDPEVISAEAEDLIAKHGPNFELKDLLAYPPPAKPVNP